MTDSERLVDQAIRRGSGGEAYAATVSDIESRRAQALGAQLRYRDLGLFGSNEDFARVADKINLDFDRELAQALERFNTAGNLLPRPEDGTVPAAYRAPVSRVPQTVQVNVDIAGSVLAEGDLTGAVIDAVRRAQNDGRLR